MCRPLLQRVSLMLIAIFLFALISPLFAAEKSSGSASEKISVEVEPVTGSVIKGKLLTDAIRIKTEYGVLDVDISHLEHIYFKPKGSTESKDSIEMDDEQRIRGLILNETLWIETESGEQTLACADLRELRVTHKKEASSFANAILGLITLTAMEIVLGIDNIIFLAIIVGKLPQEQQAKARQIGLMAALGTRILLLLFLSFLLGLTKPLFTVPEIPMFQDLEAREISLRDLILLVGGLFLIAKSTMEMHEKLEAADRTHEVKASNTATFGKVLIQIALIDIIFSLDSVVTAVGLVDERWVMIVAMIIAMVVMLVFAGTIGDFVGRHPTLKVLALSFLILIGVMLVIESLGQHLNKGYIYFAMAFAVIVEFINLKLTRKADPVQLHNTELAKHPKS